jgi:hypothetical protein
LPKTWSFFAGKIIEKPWEHHRKTSSWWILDSCQQKSKFIWLLVSSYILPLIANDWSTKVSNRGWPSNSS